MEIESAGKEQLPPKIQLLMAMFCFAEVVREAQIRVADIDSAQRIMSNWIRAMVVKGSRLRFPKGFPIDSNMPMVPTPYQAMKSFMETDHPTHYNSALFSHTANLVNNAMTWQDIRIQHLLQTDRCMFLLTLGLDQTFMGYESVLQVGVSSNNTLQLAIATGIKPALTMDGTAFYDFNLRRQQGQFPPSIALEFTPGGTDYSRVQHIYTYGVGGKYKSFTDLA